MSTRNPRTAVSRLALLLLATAALCLAMTWTALAASARVERLEVSMFGDPATRKVMYYVTQTLSPAVPLPAEVSFAIPSGSIVTWAGEVVDDAAGGPVKLQPSVAKGEGHDVLTMTLTGSRTAHVEALMSQEMPPAGSQMAPTLAYRMLEDVGSASVGIQVPAGSEVASATPGIKTTPVSGGATLYFIEGADLKAGDTLPVTVSFSDHVDEQAVSETPSLLLPAFLAAVGIPVVVFFVRKSRRRRAS